MDAIAEALYAWGNTWAAGRTSLHAFERFPMTAYVAAVTDWLGANTWVRPEAVYATGCLLFRWDEATGLFVPAEMDSHVFILSGRRLVCLRVNVNAAGEARVVSGFELFVALEAGDLQAFVAGHFRCHVGFFTDGLCGQAGPIPAYATNWVRRQYREYIDDVMAHLQTLPGTYQAPLHPGWRTLRNPDGRLFYEHVETRRQIYERPSLDLPEPTAVPAEEEKKDDEPDASPARAKKPRRKASKPRRPKLPDHLRDEVWDTYIGREHGVAPCVCCKQRQIEQRHFQCGHVLSHKHGGPDVVENLRPICGWCNSKMGSKHMADFMAARGFGPVPEAIHQLPEERQRPLHRIAEEEVAADFDISESESESYSESDDSRDEDYVPPVTRARAAAAAKKK